MKKIFTTLALAAISLAGFAQATQQYMRVTFNVPMTDIEEVKSGKPGTPVSSGMKDDFTYVNPQHQYIDFNVTEHPMTFRSTTTRIDERGSFYLHQVRNTQSKIEDADYKMPYTLDKIESITQYSIPVEKVELLDAKPVNETTYNDIKIPGGGALKTYNVWQYTFNRLPRNLAELKTLMENADGSRIQRCYDDPAFIVAVMYLLIPRFLDCQQDCRDMIDYMFGKFHPARGITHCSSNADFQDLCIGHYNGTNGKENGTFWKHNHVYQWFDGAVRSNQFKPNGKGYGYDNGPYTVFVLQDKPAIKEERFFLIANPYVSKSDLLLDDPTSMVVYLAKTDNDGWFFDINFKNYFGMGKMQVNPDL